MSILTPCIKIWNPNFFTLPSLFVLNPPNLLIPLPRFTLKFLLLSYKQKAYTLLVEDLKVAINSFKPLLTCNPRSFIYLQNQALHQLSIP